VVRTGGPTPQSPLGEPFPSQLRAVCGKKKLVLEAQRVVWKPLWEKKGDSPLKKRAAILASFTSTYPKTGVPTGGET